MPQIYLNGGGRRFGYVVRQAFLACALPCNRREATTIDASSDGYEILSDHDQSLRGPKCKGMEGLLAEGAEMIEEEADEEVRDAGCVLSAR